MFSTLLWRNDRSLSPIFTERKWDWDLLEVFRVPNYGPSPIVLGNRVTNPKWGVASWWASAQVSSAHFLEHMCPYTAVPTHTASVSSQSHGQHVPRSCKMGLCLEQGRHSATRMWPNVGEPEAPQNLFCKRQDSILRAFPPLLDAHRQTKKSAKC